MKKFIKKLLATIPMLTLAFASTASAGGLIPANWGMTQGNMRMIPASQSLIRYDYYGAITPDVADIITYSVASLDVETLKYQVLYGKVLTEVAAGNTVLRFKGVNDTPDAGCQQDNPATCVYAVTTCDTWTDTTGPYKRCSAYKITLNLDNIYLASEVKGQTPEQLWDWLHAIVRHEVTHMIGFSHAANIVPEGPMTNGANPLTDCQLDVLNDYLVTSSVPSWVVVPSCIQTQ
jgi:hypothetical protein